MEERIFSSKSSPFLRPGPWLARGWRGNLSWWLNPLKKMSQLGLFFIPYIYIHISRITCSKPPSYEIMDRLNKNMLKFVAWVSKCFKYTLLNHYYMRVWNMKMQDSVWFWLGVCSLTYPLHRPCMGLAARYLQFGLLEWPSISYHHHVFLEKTCYRWWCSNTVLSCSINVQSCL